MSKRSEKAALKAYPIHSVLIQPARRGGYYADGHLRDGFIKGYEQAEKDLADAFQAEYAKELARADLALTWEDIQAIDNIIVYMAQNTDWPLRGQEVFYEEVLRRFREMKEDK